jgi:hypothetical protein
MLQRNALPNQCSTGSMIRPRSFNDVATQPDHWQSLCRTGIFCQRFRVDQVLRRDSSLTPFRLWLRDLLRQAIAIVE